MAVDGANATTTAAAGGDWPRGMPPEERAQLEQAMMQFTATSLQQQHGVLQFVHSVVQTMNEQDYG